ncbi:MAG: hypothetical protein COY66_01840 [Candidatus Kerfeldbacteria bacterium CG_4_10_14_0_8_um_filter_42_10]|uniref:HEAT repeat domain-containing protein n=1 Tax=Candidatus Kerfeldbacteria bacterium CG_4_10_14_0_8_um_filter_42_10 TaxID=2014248 RepID=A0A2M7RJQ6_9BACT|nr:MAG: hypothetical protein COY66_01840 [Candidatus Kerfeldbacteria bacterium CG_4_10_14_0_8_um_filter_42_10]
MSEGNGGSKKGVLHETIISMLQGEFQDVLDELACGDLYQRVPVLGVLVANSTFPEDARLKLITAFIDAGKQTSDDEVCKAVAMVLQALGGGEELLRVIAETGQGEERDCLVPIAEQMGLEVPVLGEDGGE